MGLSRRLMELARALRPDSSLWRRALVAGIEHGPEPWLRYSPPAFGLAFAAALPSTRAVVRRNLRRLLGPRPASLELADVARVFEGYASCLTEAMLLGTDRGFALASRVVGAEHYAEAARARRGIVLATAHTGGWEIAGHMLSGVHSGEVVLVMRAERDQRARAMHDHARERAGMRVVHVGDDATDAFALLGHLRRNAAVAFQIDRVPPGMRARTGALRGAPFAVPEGPLRLAAASGAPVLLVLTRRLGFLDYEARLSPPLWLPRRPAEAELDGAAQRLVDALGAFLVENPTQWFHFV
jgi:KDO2-lipid IV(A) lauroyltransferase